MSFFINVFSIFLLLFSCFYVAISDKENIYCFLVFAFPFAAVFKYGTIGTSLFFVVIVVAVIKCLFTQRNVDFYFVVCFLPFFIIASIGVFSFHGVFQIIKLSTLLLLLYLFCKNNEFMENKQIIWFYIFAVLFSSLLGLFKDHIPRLGYLIGEASLSRLNQKDGVIYAATRFSGLDGDPNYYTALLMPAIIILLTLLFQRKQKYKFLIFLLFCTFSYFGVKTLSKSFALIYVFSALIILVFNLKKHPLSTVLILLLLVFIIIANPFGLLTNIFLRLDSSLDFSNLSVGTSGRSVIWASYWNSIMENPFRLLFGYGIGADYLNGYASHNIYIESIYKIGLIGFSLFFLLCSIIFCKNISVRDGGKVFVLNFLPLTVTLILLFFLEGLTNYDLFFYLIVSFSFINFLSNKTLTDYNNKGV